MSVSFKAFLYERSWRGDPVEIRRFNVDQDVSTNYAYLLQKVCQVCQVFPTVTTGNVSLAWTDSDGDLIAISSDEELVEALGQFDGSLFKLYILKKNTASTTAGGTPEQKPSEQQQPDTSQHQGRPRRHWGVVCDGCNGPIAGIRYKCLVCEDYDLCSGCEGKGIHVDHNMLTINDPGSYHPWGRGWGGRQCGRGGWGGRGGWSGRSCHGRGPWGQQPPPFGGPGPFNPACPLWGVFGNQGAWGSAGGQTCGKKGGQTCGTKCGKEHTKKEQPTGAEPMDTEQTSEEEQRRETVRNIGQAVSSWLQPFGIKVDVDVAGDEAEKKQETSGASAPEVTPEVVEEAIAQLKSMGYEDDGGWLTELVKAKGGDISKVLDALHFTETD